MKITRRTVNRKWPKRRRPLPTGRRLPWDRAWRASRTDGQDGHERPEDTAKRHRGQPAAAKSVESSIRGELQNLARILKNASVELDRHFEAAISARNLSIEARSLVAHMSAAGLARLLDGCRHLMEYARWRMRDVTVRELGSSVDLLSELVKRLPSRTYRLRRSTHQPTEASTLNTNG